MMDRRKFLKFSGCGILGLSIYPAILYADNTVYEQFHIDNEITGVLYNKDMSEEFYKKMEMYRDLFDESRIVSKKEFYDNRNNFKYIEECIMKNDEVIVEDVLI